MFDLLTHSYDESKRIGDLACKDGCTCTDYNEQYQTLDSCKILCWPNIVRPLIQKPGPGVGVGGSGLVQVCEKFQFKGVGMI